MKRVLAVAVLLAAAFAAPAADAPALPQIDAAGLQQELARHRGKVVIVNLWASWCTPCLKEIPMLMRLGDDLDGVQVFGVAMDDPGEGTIPAGLRARYFPGFRTFLRGEKQMDALVQPLDAAWNEILPTTYLIARDGRVAQKIQGVRSYEEFRGLVEPLTR